MILCLLCNITIQILIHIADAPPHGSCYHIPTGRTGDKYSDESPNNCWPLLTELLRLNITYLFGYIKKGRTDPMIKHFNETFQKIQGAVDGDKCNMEIIQFDAQNPSAVLEAINKTVSQSIGALERKSTQEHHMRKAVSTKLENDKNPSKLNSRTATCVFRLSRDYHTGSIDDLSSTKNTREHLVKGNDMQIQLAELPFSVGVQNQAFHAYNKITGEKMVFKLSRFLERSERDARQRVLDTLTIHNIARYFAKLFNADKPTNVQHLYFVEIGMCEIENETNSTSLYLFEEHIEGEYKKFNSNVGWYSKSAPSSVLQAFSHYTWIKSKKSYVVCDLQGVVKDDTVYLTDPAVHYHNYMKLGYTNFSIKGMKEFFNRHNCNEICKTMQLEPFVA